MEVWLPARKILKIQQPKLPNLVTQMTEGKLKKETQVLKQ